MPMPMTADPAMARFSFIGSKVTGKRPVLMLALKFGVPLAPSAVHERR